MCIHLKIHSQGRVLGMRTLPVADMQVRHLKTLGMEQVAAAIRTHGMGLADNAVNVTYQFLARKITMLSQVGSPLLVSHALSSRDDEQLQIQGTVPWLVTMTVSALLHLSKVPNELSGGVAQTSCSEARLSCCAVPASGRSACTAEQGGLRLWGKPRRRQQRAVRHGRCAAPDCRLWPAGQRPGWPALP